MSYNGHFCTVQNNYSNKKTTVHIINFAIKYLYNYHSLFSRLSNIFGNIFVLNIF